MERENRDIINSLEEENQQLWNRINILEEDCNKLRKQNKKLILIAFPDATKKILEGFSSIAKTIKESVDNE